MEQRIKEYIGWIIAAVVIAMVGGTIIWMLLPPAGAENVTVHVVRAANTTYLWTGNFLPLACDVTCQMQIPDRNTTTALPAVIAGNLTVMHDLLIAMNRTISGFNATSNSILTSAQAASLFDVYKSAILSDLSQRFADQRVQLDLCSFNITYQHQQDLDLLACHAALNSSRDMQATCSTELSDAQGVNSNYFILMLFELVVIFVLFLDHYGALPGLRRTARV